jgi:hypothetical protein
MAERVPITEGQLEALKTEAAQKGRVQSCRKSRARAVRDISARRRRR